MLELKCTAKCCWWSWNFTGPKDGDGRPTERVSCKNTVEVPLTLYLGGEATNSARFIVELPQGWKYVEAQVIFCPEHSPTRRQRY